MDASSDAVTGEHNPVRVVETARTGTGKKTDLAVALAGSGRYPVKAISNTLGIARLNIINGRDGNKGERGPQERPGDIELAGAIRRVVDARPTYGYRMIAALLRRERRSNGLTPVYAKRVYRLMTKHGLLLESHTGRRPPREHNGQVAMIRSNCRWCSEALEFTCWNGEVVRVALSTATTVKRSVGSPPPPASPAR